MTYYTDDRVTIHHGDALEVLRSLPDASVDSVVTDPPYLLGFMGREWDTKQGHEHLDWHRAWCDEAFRVLKPGGHLLAFGGTRTWHRLACAVEDAGFEVRDSIAWLYGSGFPKSLRVDRDERFCHCDATAHTSSGTSPEPPHVAHTRTAASSERAGHAGRSAPRATRAALGSPADCHAGRGCGDALPHPARAACLAPAPSREGAPARSHSDGREGGQGDESSRTPSPAPRTDHPSSQGYPAPYGDPSSPPSGSGLSSTPPLQTGSDSGSRTSDTRHTGAISSAWSQCTACGKPQAKGLGTAMKPAFEPVVVARKPLAGTVAANVLQHGTGALNIDATRVGTDDNLGRPTGRNALGVMNDDGWVPTPRYIEGNPAGRWPTNVVLDDSQAAELDRQSGERPGASDQQHITKSGSMFTGCEVGAFAGYNDTGGASRFFKVVSQTPSDLVFLPVESESWEQHGDASTKAANTSAGRSTESRYASSPIGGSGSKPTDPSPTATRSTTGTTTPSTTTSKISCASPLNGTTTTTSASASSTDGSPESRSAAASGATPISPSTPSPSDGQAPSTATAESAPRHTAENGSPATATSSTHDDARSEPAASTPEWPKFRYQAKAPTSERPHYTAEDGTRVAHPTTKPLDLMRWLVRLVTPPGGVVLEPFAGSGTTVEACIVEGFHCIAIEREADYLPLIMQRVNRRRDPVAYIKAAGDDLGLFELDGDGQVVAEPAERPKGRWPTNVILDRGQAEELDRQSGERRSMAPQRDLKTTESAYFGADKHPGEREGFSDTGGASRFFVVLDDENEATP